MAQQGCKRKREQLRFPPFCWQQQRARDPRTGCLRDDGGASAVAKRPTSRMELQRWKRRRRRQDLPTMLMTAGLFALLGVATETGLFDRLTEATWENPNGQSYPIAVGPGADLVAAGHALQSGLAIDDSNFNYSAYQCARPASAKGARASSTRWGCSAASTCRARSATTTPPSPTRRCRRPSSSSSSSSGCSRAWRSCATPSSRRRSRRSARCRG